MFCYKRVGKLNNHTLSVLQAENRALDFHVHENLNEMFYYLEGEFYIKFENGLTYLYEGDFLIIPKGPNHCFICKGLVKCFLIEAEGTLHKENICGTYAE